MHTLRMELCVHTGSFFYTVAREDEVSAKEERNGKRHIREAAEAPRLW